MRLIESIYSPKNFWDMGVPKGSLEGGGGILEISLPTSEGFAELGIFCR
jgi:hypothetical protein